MIEPIGLLAAVDALRGAAMQSYAAAEIRSVQAAAAGDADRRRLWLRECPKCAQPSHATVRECVRSVHGAAVQWRVCAA